MYKEFIITYIGLGVIAVLLIVAIVLLIVLINKTGSGGAYTKESSYSSSPAYSAPKQTVPGIVFCPNCGAQFDSKHAVCPKCGKPR